MQADIARSSSTAHQITGAVLVVPYTRTERVTRIVNNEQVLDECKHAGVCIS